MTTKRIQEPDLKSSYDEGGEVGRVQDQLLMVLIVLDVTDHPYHVTYTHHTDICDLLWTGSSFEV